ncbi:MAG: type II toxin-antitoxin system VapC family toxin [Opitutaceae bacterium]
MSRTHLLNTSVYSQPVRRTTHPAVATRWKALAPEAVAISSICEAEVLHGLRKHGSERMRRTYDTMLHGRYPMLPVGAEVAAIYADVRSECERLGVTVGPMDLLIAATAKTHSLTVATLNYRDFACIPGLAVERLVPAAHILATLNCVAQSIAHLFRHERHHRSRTPRPLSRRTYLARRGDMGPHRGRP